MSNDITTTSGGSDIPNKSWSLEQLGEFVRDELRRTALSVWKIGTALEIARNEAKGKKGAWGQWCKTYAPEYSDTTIWRFRNVATLAPEKLEGKTPQEAYDLYEATAPKKLTAKGQPKKKSGPKPKTKTMAAPAGESPAPATPAAPATTHEALDPADLEVSAPHEQDLEDAKLRALEIEAEQIVTESESIRDMAEALVNKLATRIGKTSTVSTKHIVAVVLAEMKKFML